MTQVSKNLRCLNRLSQGQTLSMSASSNKNATSGIRRLERDTAGNEPQLNNTFMRLRSALLEDRLSAMELSDENTGNDPYNSGTHRALGKATVWSKRSR